MKIALLGAGAWGTALAHHAASRHETWLWSRSGSLAGRIDDTHANPVYLPGIALAPGLRASADLAACVARADLVVVATSLAGLRPTLGALGSLGWRGSRASDGARAVSWLCKGLEAQTGLLPHQVAAEVLPGASAGCLSGPSFAQEVARGLPVALTAAATDPALADALVAAFHHDAMRVYRSTDLTGVEVGGALKNVMAIATGISDGLGLGLNTRAALMTRGLAEICRFGVALGASRETFMGLAGMGDLVLTCTGDLSRNRSVGLRLAAGEALADVLAQLGHVAEGVACCRAVVSRAAQIGVEMPICAIVLDVLEGRRAPADAVRALLAREPRTEG